MTDVTTETMTDPELPTFVRYMARVLNRNGMGTEESIRSALSTCKYLSEGSGFVSDEFRAKAIAAWNEFTGNEPEEVKADRRRRQAQIYELLHP